MRRHLIPSLPGIARRKTRVNALMTRQSILLRKKMDARVKPAHDDSASTAINRRAFTSLLAAAAAAAVWPLAARAQQMPDRISGQPFAERRRGAAFGAASESRRGGI